MQHRAVPAMGALVLGTATVLLAGILSPTARATPAPRPPAAPSAPAKPHTVTLITGDKVTLTPTAAAPLVTVQRPADAPGSVRTVTDDTGTYVYPADTEAYVARGILDKRLFNVTGLIAQGYDDTRSPGLPLIISRDTGASRLTTADLPGVSLTRQLDSVRAVAATTDRRETARLWNALSKTPQPTAGKGQPPSLPGAVDRIWLDGKAEAALADSTTQIGAPQVWDQGATGTGVKIAVLDTGVDADHPDLAQRIVSTHSFVPGEDITDRRGHGTHVASIIAGTGAASAGKEKGVAPGAHLAIAKVLSDAGTGTESGIIAGMEWAAVTERAKIVNLSLGNASTHHQNDPMSQAVNALSAQTGALFVIAAGNSGPGPHTVNSPGTAAAALTVAAVDSADTIAGFSSSGPRTDDGGLKPDLSAPGVNVLAARSQHLPGEGPYTAKSGTSMATPHVAGAAALLAAKHPDWTGQQLKDALMSTTTPTTAIPAHRGGTGRTDIAAAYRAQVTASGAVDTGLIKWSATPQPAEHRITYTNTGDHPVTLRLTLDRGTAPAGLFTLETDRITVPPHAGTPVRLTVDPRGVPVGSHTGQVSATDSAGAVLAHTVLAATTESEHHDLTLRAKDRNGHPMTGTALLVPAGAPHFQPQWHTVPETGLTLHLPRDTYSVTMFQDVQGAHGPHSKGTALLGDPEVELTAPRTVTFDASLARQVRALTPDPSTVTGTRIEYWRSFTTRRPQYGTTGDWIESKLLGPEYDSVWAQPTPGRVTVGGFALTTRWRAPQTPLTVTSAGDDLDVLLQKGAKALAEGTTTTDAVFAGTGTPAEYARLSAAGKVAVVRRTAAVAPHEQARAAHAAGVKLLLVVNDAVGRLNTWYGLDDYTSDGPVPVASVTRDDGEALIARISAAHGGTARLRLTSHPTPSYLYDLVAGHEQAVPADPTHRVGPHNLARVDQTFGQDRTVRAAEARTDFPSYAFNAGLAFLPEPVARGSRTDWISVGTDVTWQQRATAENRLTETSERASYAKAGTHTDRWFTPVLRPRMITEDLPVRQYGGTLRFGARAWGGNGTAHAGEGYAGGGLSQSTSVYQGETLLDRFDHAAGHITGLPEEAKPYRIVVDAANDGSAGPYSTTTRTEWSFVSAAAEQQTVPLVQLDYAVDLDADGRARRTAPLHITPLVPGAPGAKVSSVRLEVSYDEGATWHRPRTVHRDGTWKASLDAPASASSVSLRTTAEAGRGSSVAQTVIRAYGLK
ncbi:S8 family serine peptidase [Streptomyces erythrochromogenes]|uniref:S8 family serine peptidase n=1 Tax=Streptomyces erythrochromogenes TaxID=285574 RepID=UPI0037D6F958